MGKYSARASSLAWEAHTGNFPLHRGPVHPQPLGAGCERQRTLTWDLPAHASTEGTRAAPSGQEIPAIPLHQIRSCEFLIEALGSPSAAAVREGGLSSTFA